MSGIYLFVVVSKITSKIEQMVPGGVGRLQVGAIFIICLQLEHSNTYIYYSSGTG